MVTQKEHAAGSRLRRPAFLIAGLLVAAGLWMSGPRWPSDHGAAWVVAPGAPPRLIAHAGGIDLFPANTMVAFLGSAALGVDVLEMDVQLTADDRLVTMHDDTLERTTDGRGPVRARSLADVLALDAAHGYRTSAGTAPWAGTRVPPAALADVFATFAPTALDFVVELKNSGEEGVIAARRLAALLVEYGLEARIIVCSFHLETLMAFRSASSGRVATSGAGDEIALMVLPARFGLDRWWYRPGPVSALQMPTRQGGLDLATAAIVAAAHAHEQAVEYWTINSRTEMLRLIDLGVDGIMTDDPARLRAVLAERGFSLPSPVLVPPVRNRAPLVEDAQRVTVSAQQPVAP